MLKVHVVLVSNLWEVRADGRDTTSWPTEWQALRFARFIAERDGGAEITVSGRDGAVRTEHHYQDGVQP